MDIKKKMFFLGGGASFDSDAQAFFTAAGITDATQKSAVNTMVVALKAAGLWTKSKAIYPYVGGTATTHKYNLKDPRDLDAAYRIVWFGGITHNTNGVTFNGSTGYGDTKLNALTVFAGNPCSMHSYVRTRSNTGMYMSAGSSNWDWSANNNINVGGASGANTSAATVVGMSSIIRISATVAKVFEGDSLTPVSQAFSANTSDTFTVGSFGGGSLFTDANIAFQAIMDNLTVSEAQTLNDIVFNYELALSRNLARVATFCGDSITVGFGITPVTDSWTYLFTAAKGLTNKNNALSGTPLESAVTVVSGNLYDNMTAFIPRKTAQRKYLFICHVRNDCYFISGTYTRALFTSQYQACLTYALSVGWLPSQIYMCYGFYCTNWSGGSATNADYVNYNSDVSALAITNGCNRIDFSGVYSSADTQDNIHPNAAGAVKMNNYISPLIP